jgi:hypothetical protein
MDYERKKKVHKKQKSVGLTWPKVRHHEARAAADFSVAAYTVVEKIVLWGGILTALIIGSIAIHRINRHLAVDEISSLRQHSKTFVIPVNSKQVADHIYEIKHASHPNITGLMIVHHDKPKEYSVNKKSKITGYEMSVSGTCYAAYAKGAKWKTKKNYLLDTSNNQGLSASFVKNAMAAATGAWNEANTNGDIYGVLDTQHTAQGIDFDQPDGRNEIHFAYINEDGVLAFTIVWGIFSGPESSREIIEFDQVYNENYPWGDASSNPSVNDLQNTMTHECGHGCGLRDIYDGVCAQVTMYAYAAAGETKKRSLAVEDIRGINALSNSASAGSGSGSHGSHVNPAQNDAPGEAGVILFSKALLFVTMLLL